MSPTRKSPFGVLAWAMVTSASEASIPLTVAPRPLASCAAKPDPQAMSITGRLGHGKALEDRLVGRSGVRLYQVRPVGCPVSPGLPRLLPLRLVLVPAAMVHSLDERSYTRMDGRPSILECGSCKDRGPMADEQGLNS